MATARQCAATTTGAPSGYAGLFYGNTWVAGTLFKNAGAFRIGPPLDPANKYLSHSFVESPDMKNIYDGVATTTATAPRRSSCPRGSRRSIAISATS